MLVASRRIELLERFRIPYVVDEASGDLVRIARVDGNGAELLFLPGAAGAAQNYSFEGSTIHASLADPIVAERELAGSGRSWSDDVPICDARGTVLAVTRRGSDGSIYLPFDLDAPVQAFFDEDYRSGSRTAHRLLVRTYYATRGALPRNVQLALRRRYRVVQDRSSFPSWPTETSLHRFELVVLNLISSVVGEPVPWLAPWPAPYSWAMVLTHDVERTVGYAHIPALRALEAEHGLRSAWYFVPERDYKVDEAMLERLRVSGCEIGLHGLRHDGRDLEPGTFSQRLSAMRQYADLWGARGFRSPSTLRRSELVEQLGVDYDSSWSDVARYEPEAGGCCSWLPYFIGAVVELPITLPQDHTLFDLHGEDNEDTWLQKASFLREHGGMSLILTHPDYLLDPTRMDAYDRFLSAYASDRTAWHALPIEVADWWRRRSSSSIVRSGDTWTVVGPAAGEAQIRLDFPAAPPPSASATPAVTSTRSA